LDIDGKITGQAQVPVLVGDNGDGTYGISYTPTQTGNYKLTVNCNSQPIGGKSNPFSFIVVPAPPSPEHTIAYGPGTEKGTVGRENKFTVETRDPYDNKVTMGGANIGGRISPLGISGGDTQIEVKDNGDGTYTCGYPGVTMAGDYELTPTLDNVPIKGAPFKVKVTPGVCDSDNATVLFPDVNMSGKPGPMVQLLDQYNNKLQSGGDDIIAEITPKSKLPPIKAKDNGDGTYDIDYPPNLKGKYDVVVLVNGKEAPGGPWEVDVEEDELGEEVVEKVERLMPGCSAVFKRLLVGATESERERILKEIQALAGVQ